MRDWVSRLRVAVAARWPRLLALVQRLFLAIALIAIATYLARHADELRTLLSWQVARQCSIAALLLAAIQLLISLAFFELQQYNGIVISLPVSIGIYMRRIPARYVPGGIWHSVSRLADMRIQASVAVGQLRRQFLFETAVVATSGLLVCGLAFLASSGHAGLRIAAGAQAGAGLLLSLLAFAFVRRKANWRKPMAALLLFLMIWPLAAVAFSIIADSMTDCGHVLTASTYLVAAVQGYIAIFSPQGWGVAEASFAFFDPCHRPLHQVLAAFLLYRLSTMAGDLVSYFAWALIGMRASIVRRASCSEDE